jgi:hypothetical protein
MEGHAVAHPIHLQSGEIGVVVVVAEERRLLLISPRDDVVEEAGAKSLGRRAMPASMGRAGRRAGAVEPWNCLEVKA